MRHSKKYQIFHSRLLLFVLLISLPTKIPGDPFEIDVFEYIEYLKGEIYNDTYTELDYNSMTMNLNDYFLYGEARLSNETDYRNDALTFLHTVNFNGPYNGGEFHKCFEVSSDLHLQGHVKALSIYYNISGLLVDLQSEYPIFIWYTLHYPGQFLLAPNDPSWLSIQDRQTSDVWIVDVEYLKSRNSQRRTCTIQKGLLSFDNMVANEHVIQHGCIPPYLKPQNEFPVCNTQEDLKRALYSFNRIRKNTFL